MITDLSRATPREIDAELARLDREAQHVNQQIATHQETLHHILGERATRHGRSHKAWPTTTEQVVELIRARGDQVVPGYVSGDTFADYLARYEDVLAARDAIDAQAEPLNAEYARRPWSRFFWVQGGHAHSSMNCSTCNNGVAPTLFGWEPELSGLDEAAAVAKLGPNLCTVCFPSAPVEYTCGVEKPRCPGASKQPRPGTVSRTGMRRYGECIGCGERHIITQGGQIRAHPPAKTDA
jgi:hypothetical protein